MANPICFALDFPNLGTAANFIQEHSLYHHVGAVKVGLELFVAAGPRAIEVLSPFGLPIVLDLKLHDIPETVARAVKAGGDLGVKYMTMHIQQRSTLEAALKAAEPFGITLLGVTVLTRMSEVDCQTLRLVGTWPPFSSSRGGPSMGPTCWPADRAQHLAQFAYEVGLRGFVCSPQEVRSLKEACPEGFFLVPGVRPAGSETGDDQKRVGTPAQAVKDGANLIVVGRPIRDAKDPVEAAKAILHEIRS